MAHFLVNYLPICTFMGFRINIENQLNTCNRIFGLIFMALKTNSIPIVQCRSKFYNNFECLDICLILKIQRMFSVSKLSRFANIFLVMSCSLKIVNHR